VDEADKQPERQPERNGGVVYPRIGDAAERRHDDRRAGEDPREREIDMAEQDHQHRAGGEDAEEGGDLELLQQVGGGEEVADEEAAADEQQRATDDDDDDREVEAQPLHCSNAFSFERVRSASMAPMPMATASTSPSKKGCASGGRPVKNISDEIVLRMSAPRTARIGVPTPPVSGTPPSTTAAIELSV